MKKYLLVLMMFTFGFMNCNDGGNSNVSDAVLASTLLHSANAVRNKCITSTLIMNQCVGAGFQAGFNAENMCSDANLKTEAEYDKLIKCASAKVNTTNCNFPQNKAGDARVAYANFFKGCITEESLTDGIVVTDWFTVSVPKF